VVLQSRSVLIHPANGIFTSADASGEPNSQSELPATDTLVGLGAERRIEHLMESADRVTGVGLAIISGQVRYVEVNKCLAALNGIPKDAHCGRLISEVVPEIAPMLTPMILRAIQSNQPLTEVTFIARVPFVNGPLRDWLASFFPVDLGGGTIGVAHTVTDITERARLESSLAYISITASAPSHQKPLTTREGDVLTLIGQGKMTKEIASLLSISPQTVGNHRKQICQKLIRKPMR
jgi:DNA-binding CsgD family transcriptional regulator